jgi:hypothetical protein
VAAAAAIQPWPVVTNAVVQTDTAGAFMLFLVFHVALGVDQSRRFRHRDAALLGISLGAAVAARYTSAVGVTAILCVVVAGLRRGDLAPRRALMFLASAGTVALGTFVAIVPGCLHRFDAFKASLLYEYRSKQAVTTWDLDQFWDSLTQCAPIWILIPTAVGAALAWRTRPSAGLLGSFLSLLVYFAMTAKALMPDYCMPLMPLAAALTGISLWKLANANPLAPAGRSFPIAAGAFVLAWLGVTSVTVHERYAGDTRYQADAWIKANIPPGPLGFAPSGLRRKRTALRAPAGYEFVDVHDKPEWIVIPRRRSLPIYNVYEDPGHYPKFPFDPKARTLGLLGLPDFDFFEDVLFQKRRDYHYDLVQEIKRSPWPLDYRGYDVKIYRKTASR